jgi:hypothetical protein
MTIDMARILRLFRLLAWAFLVFCLALVPSWLLISQGSSTPFDEAAHFDFVDKLAHGEVPEVNEQYGQRTLWMMACLGPESPAWSPIGECKPVGLYDPNLAPFNGQSSATGYSPTFYIGSAFFYRTLLEIDERVDLSLNELQLARLANSIWGGLAAVMVFIVSLRLRISKINAMCIALCVSSAPALILQFANVNSDAGGQFAVVLAFMLAFYANEIFLKKTRMLKSRVCSLLIIFGLLCTIKETTLLVLPGALFIALQNTSFAFERNPKAKEWARLVRMTYVVAATLAVAAITLLSRAIQPLLRGKGGEDWMAILLPLLNPDSDNLRTLFNETPHQALSAFSNVPWSDLTDVFGNYSTIIMSLMPFIFVGGAMYQSRCSDPDSGRGSITSTRTIGQAYLINLLALPIGAFCLGLASLIVTGTTVTQPRYYMAASTGLVLLGVWSHRDVLGKIAMKLLILPWLLTVFSIVN